jgi:hypothetical protein
MMEELDFTKILVKRIRNINPKFDYGATDNDVIFNFGMWFDPIPKQHIYNEAADEYAEQMAAAAFDEIKELKKQLEEKDEIIVALKQQLYDTLANLS